MINPLAHGLPDFPWDRIAAAGDVARSHPDGIVDLSIGTPVDPTPSVIQRALAEHADAPGYPTAAGIPQLREAMVDWAARVLGATSLDVDSAIPTLGSKEAVAWLPIVLGLNANSTVAIPQLAYPTYAVGAMMAGAKVVTYQTAADIPSDADLVWVNSPSNPTGEVLDADQLKELVARSREIGAVLFSDECYFELGWTADPVSVLHPSVVGTDYCGVVAVHSMSKRSNLAGYRSGLLLGDSAVIGDILALRKHAGMLMPTAVQFATIAGLTDAEHVAEQKQRYAARRERLLPALIAAGFTVTHSQAGLYLWSTRGESSLETVAWLAKRGILVAPGDFYGTAGNSHVRVALTGTDERIAAAVGRLTA